MDEFERHKEALAVKKLEKPKTIFQQFSQFYGEIAMQTYHFEREEAEVAILRKISKADFVDYFKVREYGSFKVHLGLTTSFTFQKFIAKDGEERRVLSVHIVSQQTDENATSEAEPVEITNMERHKPISDIVTFKSCKELYPIALPFLDIKAKGARSKL